MNDAAKEFFSRDDAISEADHVLIRAYRQQGLLVDWLPYSKEFEAIFSEAKANGDPRDRGQIYRRLLNLRKSGRLPPVQLGMTG
ncbi:MAG: hypothetical protein ACKVZJ_01015 [Phycisphaerales bacterium]